MSPFFLSPTTAIINVLLPTLMSLIPDDIMQSAFGANLGGGMNSFYLTVGAGIIFTTFMVGAAAALFGLHWWLP